jgi:hypothetical protein
LSFVQRSQAGCIGGPKREVILGWALKASLVRQELETLRSTVKRGDRDEDAIELPDDWKEQLRALGYLLQ